jgi:hypothetical protein
MMARGSGVVVRWWVGLVVLGLVVVGGCSRAVAGEAVAGAGVERSGGTGGGSAEEPEGAGRLEPLVGTWRGTYTCGQGLTGLKLIVEAVDDETVRAVFEFFAVPENEAALSGSYQLLGAYRGDRLVFRQEKWIEQPENYLMVDLEVTSPVEPEMSEFSGDVLSPSCEDFTVTRVR